MVHEDVSAMHDECIRVCKAMYAKVQQMEPVKTELWKGPDPGGGKVKSQTVQSCSIKVFGSDEEITVPVWTSAKVQDVANLLASRVGVDPTSLEFVAKKGCHFKKLWEMEEIGPRVVVKGIKSFKRQWWPREDPIAIIGAGHLGLKTAMNLLKRKDSNFVIFDRFDVVGGSAWLQQANVTSKLQTEYGVYHLDYDVDAPIPTYFPTPWPSCAQLLEMFKRVAEEYGILPYCRMNTNVKNIEVVKHEHERHLPGWMKVKHIDLFLNRTDVPESPEETFKAFSIMLYPGNLSIPRRQEYKGEDVFDGPIGYGMHSAFDYNQVVGKDVMIVGHGAFAVENVRTCCEYRAGKLYMVCRRKNVACPRVTSWLCNRSSTPVSAALFIHSAEPMYKLTPFDPWSYYAVKHNMDKTQVTFNQKARFGIGDIYFLSIYYGKLEVIEEPVGPIKRLSRHAVHLESGRRLEVQAILKLLGFYGDYENDRLMKAKEIVGHWVNDDVRRFIWAEPISVQAQNFAGTSFSPGALTITKMGIHFNHYPMDYQIVSDSYSLPRYKGDPDDVRPIYVVDARHAVTTGMVVSSLIPSRGLEDMMDNMIKPVKQRLCHPIATYIAQAKEDWDHYCEIFQEQGFDKPWPPYPYSVESAKQLVIHHMQTSGEHLLPCDLEDLGQDFVKQLPSSSWGLLAEFGALPKALKSS